MSSVGVYCLSRRCLKLMAISLASSVRVSLMNRRGLKAPDHLAGTEEVRAIFDEMPIPVDTEATFSSP